jgi:hypothetical protein
MDRNRLPEPMAQRDDGSSRVPLLRLAIAVLLTLIALGIAGSLLATH